MYAAWNNAIPVLRVAMLRQGVRLPDIPATDGRWRPCEVVGASVRGTGRYLLFPTPPVCALFKADGDSRATVAWYSDASRILTMQQQQRVMHAIAQLPAETDEALVELVRAPEEAGGAKMSNAVPPAAKPHIAPPDNPVLVPCSPPLTAHAPSPRTGALSTATAVLSGLLNEGPTPTMRIFASARAMGISVGTVRRAGKLLRVVAIRSGFGGDGGWAWRLPR